MGFSAFPLMNCQARSPGPTHGWPYIAVGMHSAVDSSIGLPSMATSARRMLALVTPPEVSSSFTALLASRSEQAQARGVLSYGVHDLQEAGILPGLHTLAFDVSDVITPGSVAATLLKGIFNFSPATSVLEAVAWVAYVVPTMWLFVRMAFGAAPAKPAATPASAPEPASANA